MRRISVALVLALLVQIGLPTRAAATAVTTEFPAGIEAFGLTLDPRDGKMYAATSDHNRTELDYMWIVDPASPPPYDPAALPRFLLPPQQVMSVLDTKLDRLFVTARGGLTMLDLPTRTIVGNFALEHGGVGVALDPTTHRLFVATINDVFILDGGSPSFVARRRTASVNDAYWHVAHDPYTQRVYVTNGNFSGAPSLLVLSDSDLSFIAEVPLPAVPRLALAVDVGRGLVYVGGFSRGVEPAGKLYAIDEASLQIVRDVDVGGGVGSPMSLTMAGDLLYVSTVSGPVDGSGNAMVLVDAPSFTVVDRIRLPFQPGQSAIGSDGRIYVTEFDRARVAALERGNHAPFIRGLAFVPAAPATSDRLTISVDASDPDLGPFGVPTFPASVSYDWSRNGVPLAATGDTLDLALPGNGDRGDTISVRVTVSDGEFSASQTRSVSIGNATPSLAVALDASAPRTNDVLHAIVSTSDADGDAVALTYGWSRNGVIIAGATGAALDLGLTGDRGDVISLSVTASDGHGGSRTGVASATVADSAPAVGNVTLNTTSPGSWDTLIANVAATDADGDNLFYTWHLLRNGTVVRVTSGDPFAAFSLFDQGVGDRGDIMTVEVTVSDQLMSTTASAAATVVNTAPFVEVSLSSTAPRKSDVLVATATATDPDGDGVVFTYTWTVGKKVRQTTTTTATSDSLVLSAYTNGDVVKVSITATDGAGVSAPAAATATIGRR